MRLSWKTCECMVMCRQTGCSAVQSGNETGCCAVQSGNETGCCAVQSGNEAELEDLRVHGNVPSDWLLCCTEW